MGVDLLVVTVVLEVLLVLRGHLRFMLAAAAVEPIKVGRLGQVDQVLAALVIPQVLEMLEQLTRVAVAVVDRNHLHQDLLEELVVPVL
jgi:hypothetical protein